ncbi:hypothetical protein FRB90_001828 [Tulasnella sp. 427]|nr:hypothetical protein FRB90_001828 [Tulasnella sp. 427]
MSTVPNPTIIFVSNPQGAPVPGEHLVFREGLTLDIDRVPLNGGILTKTVALGMDPYLRNRMKYEYQPNTPFLGHGVGIVIRSDNQNYSVGSHIHSSNYPFSHYAVFSPDSKLRSLKDEGLPWHLYLGILGLAGETAWYGYKAFVHAQKGETIYVSTGAGLVGSVVCQLAKAEGLRVIASAGSDSKVQFLKELGVDVAFNYKEKDIATVLHEHGGVDIYWDNVGGRTLETVIGCMNKWGRIIICGFISEYNLAPSEYHGNQSLLQVLVKNLSIRGYVVYDVLAKLGDFGFWSDVPELVKGGKLKVKEEISKNLEGSMQMLVDCLVGKNEGKGVIVFE